MKKKFLKIFTVTLLMSLLCSCSNAATDKIGIGNGAGSYDVGTNDVDTNDGTEYCNVSDSGDGADNYNESDSYGASKVSIVENYDSLDAVPEYSGQPYVMINNCMPDFDEKIKKSTDEFEYYSELDSLGRCQAAFANICPNLQPTEERGEIGQIKPSGWHTVKYNDVIDGNYLYNRCHLIGYQLAGENANNKNLITGTRYLNVVGMLPFENEVDEYVDRTGNHVLYRVTPIFVGDNLVASGVQMEAWSVEDDGTGVCFNVYCYNVQPGIGIDYSNGNSWKMEADSTNNSSKTNTQEYVVNTNTKKFHIESCSSVKSMSQKNMKLYDGTKEDLLNAGYEPCKICIGG